MSLSTIQGLLTSSRNSYLSEPQVKRVVMVALPQRLEVFVQIHHVTLLVITILPPPGSKMADFRTYANVCGNTKPCVNVVTFQRLLINAIVYVKPQTSSYVYSTSFTLPRYLLSQLYALQAQN